VPSNASRLANAEVHTHLPGGGKQMQSILLNAGVQPSPHFSESAAHESRLFALAERTEGHVDDLFREALENLLSRYEAKRFGGVLASRTSGDEDRPLMHARNLSESALMPICGASDGPWSARAFELLALPVTSAGRSCSILTTTRSNSFSLASRLEPALIALLRDALPRIREWIVAYTESTAGQQVTVASLSVPNLARCYPKELLESTRVLIADEICYPPLEQFGLVEFKSLQETTWSGITFDDIYYLRRDVVSPVLHFHELVHVVQYQRLGIEQFLWAYSIGLALHRYEDSPLEKMAYDLQLEFEHGIYRRSLVGDIERRTDIIWQETSSQAGNW
jgi:hypothetical protein